ncbi:MAG: tRNA (adenosine(37)-N6)-threonylcarbamoyltransferase complex dimerization subunit type 1 TsaB [Candidatus Omnitrophica bacterium]|nr:tRNA (adenosine(37)-N6)-threonylcarbamoyltransferase complex dimerization subunit type 1 TsaB [Candidatus Omnitrophota bacterium]
MNGQRFNLILALDSSSRRLSFAIGGKLLGEIPHVETDKDFRHAETVVLKIDQLLKSSGLGLDKVDCLACGMGPGSFTGLRVGLAAVKAMMMARNLPCYSISTLDLIAENVRDIKGEEISSVRVLVDARQSRYYTALYKYDGHVFVKEGSDEILQIEGLISRIKGRTTLLGDGIPSFRASELAKELKFGIFFPESTWYPRASEIIRLVMENSPILKQVNIRNIEPAYLRSTEPEQRLMEMEKKRHA